MTLLPAATEEEGQRAWQSAQDNWTDNLRGIRLTHPRPREGPRIRHRLRVFFGDPVLRSARLESNVIFSPGAAEFNPWGYDF